MNDCRPHCNSYGCESNCRNCCKILESIALEETGIAHILNAEGEKIQKAVELATSIECLLKVNQSVHISLLDLTSLELNLYRKLEKVFEECDCCKQDKKRETCCKMEIGEENNEITD